MEQLARQWLVANPNDKRVARMVDELEKARTQPPEQKSGGGETP